MATSKKCGNCIPELEICNIEVNGDPSDGNLMRDPENPRNWLLHISYSVIINKIICQAIRQPIRGRTRPDRNTPLTYIRIAKFLSRSRLFTGVTNWIVQYGEATMISNKVRMRGPYTTKKVCCDGVAGPQGGKPCCEIMEEKLFECFKVKKDLYKCGAAANGRAQPAPGIVKYSADQGGKMGWNAHIDLSVRGIALPRWSDTSPPSQAPIPWLANKNKGQIAAAVRNDLRTAFIGHIQRCGHYQAGVFHIDPEEQAGGAEWLDCLDCPDSCL